MSGKIVHIKDAIERTIRLKEMLEMIDDFGHHENIGALRDIERDLRRDLAEELDG